MINACLSMLNPGGVIYFSTNLRKFQLEKEKLNSCIVKDITKATTSFDFEGKIGRYCYEISLGLRV
jgi:23S rRNA (cytosine1962-C5)-methyltransferase